jgi:hypothetical protein
MPRHANQIENRWTTARAITVLQSRQSEKLSGLLGISITEGIYTGRVLESAELEPSGPNFHGLL